MRFTLTGSTLAALTLAALAAAAVSGLRPAPTINGTEAATTITPRSAVPTATTTRALTQAPDRPTRARYIVQYHAEAWADQPEAQVRPRLARSPDVERESRVRAWRTRWERQSRDRLDRFGKTLGRRLVPLRSYPITGSAVLLELTAAEAQALAAQPEVRAISPDVRMELNLDRAAGWSGATAVWDGAAGIATRGEEVVLGVIDTGIRPELPAMRDQNAEGYTYWELPQHGLCHNNGVCSPKILAMWDFTDGLDYVEPNDGLDRSPHGSKVADVAAGSSRTVGGIPVSGLAPRARIVSLKACELVAKCWSSSVLAAVDQALVEGVNVLNLSLGRLEDGNPWQDSVNLALLRARQAGVVVVVSAGNNGDGTSVGSLGQLAISPWTLAAGAATSTRGFTSWGNSPALADELASYSSRGPSAFLSDIGKPDIAAPSIYSYTEYTSGPDWFSGTSAASAYTAGAALLLRGAYRDWSVDRITSVLSTGVSPTVRLPDGSAATGLAAGGGRLSLTRAIDQGLYFAIDNLGGQQDFDKANPAVGGDVRRLNRPNLVDSRCAGRCELLRRVTDGGTGSQWTAVVEAAPGVTAVVHPASFTLAPGATQGLVIGFQEHQALGLGWKYGRIRLERVDRTAAPVILPFSVQLTARYTAPPALLGQFSLSPSTALVQRLAPGQRLVSSLIQPAVSGYTLTARSNTNATVQLWTTAVDAQASDTAPVGGARSTLAISGGTLRWALPSKSVRYQTEIINTAPVSQEVSVTWDRVYSAGPYVPPVQ